MKIIPLYVYDNNDEIIYSPNQLPLTKLRDAYRLVADDGFLVTDGINTAEVLDVEDLSTKGEIKTEEE